MAKRLTIGDTQHRDLAITARSIDQKARRVQIAFSSEAPYTRWWGIEVLSHDPGAVVLDRIRDGGALLMDHNPTDQVGVVESASIGSDRIGRAVVRFGNSQRADEVFQDVVDGIRTKVSVGYLVEDLEQAGEADDGTPIFRVNLWTPLELSLVSIPADATVGVGRSHQHSKNGKENAMPEIIVNDDDGMSRRERREARAAGAPVGSEGPASEADSIRAILAAGDQYGSFGGPEIARQLIQERGATVETFRLRMLEAMRGRTRPSATAQAADLTHFGEGARSAPRYGGKLVAFEREEDAYRAGMWLRATLTRDESAAQWCRMNGVGTRAMGEGTLADGGAAVPVELSTAYIRLVEQYGVFRRNARIWPMNSDTLKITRRKSGLTAFFVGENSSIGTSQVGFDNVTLSTKKIGDIIPVSRELVIDSAIALSELISQEIALAFSYLEDQCGFIGDGTSTYGGMRGLTQLMIDGNHNAGKIAAATGHHTFGTIDATDLATLISAVPLFARKGAKFFVSSVGNDLTFSRLLSTLGGNRLDIVPQAIEPSYLGYPIELTQVMPASSSTDYTGKVMILFGNLNMSSAMGLRAGLEVRVLQERYADLDQIAFVPLERFDIVNHSCGDNTAAGPVVGLVGA